MGTLTAPTIGTTDVEVFDAVVLAAGDLEATFIPPAGMLGASLRHDGDELLDRSVAVAEYVAHGKTTGIPLLHPWANRLEGERYTVAGRDVVLRAGGAARKPTGCRSTASCRAVHGRLDRTADDAVAR